MKRLALLVFLAMGIGEADAVVVLQSTYEREGYRAAEKLAHQKQFRPTMLLAGKDGEIAASGTWIGNDKRHGYILTAAHNFCEDYPPDGYVYAALNGEEYEALSVTLHTDYACGVGMSEESGREGFDLALVELSRPVTGLGPAPYLYDGNEELGRVVTFVGFGSRGTGLSGETEEEFNTAAAAQGRIDDVEEAAETMPPVGTDAGNYFEVYLPMEDGSVENPFTGAEGEKPVSPYAGLLGAGDSGGGAWIEIGGRWILAGINQSGSGEARYGDVSDFVRLSLHSEWIAGSFPGVKFAH